MTTEQGYTLGEIAVAAGMTARNVRAYQTRGLIPPPLRVGRRSVYAAEHVHRLRAIHRARGGGASLTLIANHLAEGGRLEDQVPAESWLPRPREAWGSESMPASHADVSALLRRGCPDGAPAQLQALLDDGVLTRDGRRVLAGQQLAAGRLAGPLAQRAGIALAGSAGQPQELVAQLAEQLADLAGSLVRDLVRQRMARDAARV
jgi:DNA-binding transcriptional MerR regulator